MAVSRAATKLAHAIEVFGIQINGWVCADFGCNAGGFTEVMLQHGAAKVYAIDTGYGALDWNLRKDPRVVPMERTNAIHVMLPEKIDLVTIDVAWTRQRHILPAAKRAILGKEISDVPISGSDASASDAGQVVPAERASAATGAMGSDAGNETAGISAGSIQQRGKVISLIKPHYEAHARQLRAGVLRAEELPAVLEHVKQEIQSAGFEILGWTQSPIKGAKGNVEFLALLQIA